MAGRTRPAVPFVQGNQTPGCASEKGCLHQGVVESVDVAGGAWAYGHEDLGLCGQYLLGEQAGRLVGHVGFGQSDGMQAAFQGFQGAGSDGLLEHEHDT